MEEKIISQEGNELELDTKIFAAISYISGLFLITWAIKRDNQFVRFHIRQGAGLFIAEIVIWFILWILEAFLATLFDVKSVIIMAWLYKLSWLGFAGLSLWGAYHAIRGVQRPLPGIWVIVKNLKI